MLVYWFRGKSVKERADRCSADTNYCFGTKSSSASVLALKQISGLLSSHFRFMTTQLSVAFICASTMSKYLFKWLYDYKVEDAFLVSG